MESLIGPWEGKMVSVTLRVGGGFTPTGSGLLEGTLVKVGEAGVLLDLPKTGRTFVPITAILHCSLGETE